MTTEEHLQRIIGQFVVQISALNSQLDSANKRIVELEGIKATEQKSK